MLQISKARLVICLLTLLKVTAVNTTVVHVSDGQALVDAIRDDVVTSIFLDGNVRFEPEQWPATVYRLERDLLVTSDRKGDHKVTRQQATAGHNSSVSLRSISVISSPRTI